MNTASLRHPTERLTERRGAVVTDEFIYVTADEEEIYNVAQANEPLDEEGHFVHKKVSGRRKEEIIEVEQKTGTADGRFAQADGIRCDCIDSLPGKR